MLFVLSPAKNLNEKDPAPVARHTLPALLEEAAKLMDELRPLAPQQLAALMHGRVRSPPGHRDRA